MQGQAEGVDFVVITALDEEREAVFAKFPTARQLQKDGLDTHTYYETDVQSTRADGASYRVIITSLATMGPLMASQKAQAAVARWHPRNVLLVGIACGVAGKKEDKVTNLGDVLVSTQIADYTLEKVYEDGTQHIRWTVHPAGANLLDSALNLRPQAWIDMITHPRPAAGQPNRCAGVIASGGKVVANSKVISEYEKQWSKLVGIEMEAGGVANSLLNTADHPEFLMIKGVSDHGEGKEKEDVKKWREYAAHAAAAFALALVQSGPGPSVRRRRRLLAASAVIGGALVAAGIIVLGALSWRAFQVHPTRPGTPSNSTAPVTVRPAVAVLGLQNNSGKADAAWLSTAISEMLATELSAGGKLRIISAEEVTRAKADLGLGESERLSPAGLQRIRKRLDAEAFVTGSYTLIAEPNSLIRIDLRLLDAETGKDLVTASASGTEMQLFDLVSRAGARIRQQLGVGAVTPSLAIEIEASIPSKRDAVRYYTEGITNLRSLDAAAAVDSLTMALSSDNKHPLIHAALSQAYAALGNDLKAKDEAARAVALSARLGPDQRLRVQAASYEAAKDWAKAADAQASLFESFPDNLDYGLDLANSLIAAGKTKEALITIDGLRKLPPHISADGRIDLVEAHARQELGDFAEDKKLAAKAAAKGKETGARLLVARARMLEATSMFELGDIRGATAAADEARSLCNAAGDKSGVAKALELTARFVSLQGDLEGERKLLDQALAMHRQIGDSASVARVLSNIGRVLFREGRTSEAQKYFDDSLATFRQVGAKFAAGVTLNSIGAMMFNSGDLPSAQNRYSQALALFTELGDKWGTAMSLTNIAEVLGCRGEIEQARRMHEESLALNRGIGEKGGSAYDLFRLGEIHSIRGELVAARDRYQEALALQNDVGDKLGAADSQVGLAGLAIEQGHPADGERAAREAEEILRTLGAAERSVLALGVIAQSLLAQGKQKEALDTANRAWRQAKTSEDRRVRFGVAVALARARAASKSPSDVDAAITFLQKQTGEASRSLFVISEMETRLAMGEIEIASGRTAGKRHLAALARDAGSKGFAAIARRAAAGSA